LFRHKLLLASPFLIALPLSIAFVALTGATKYQSTGTVWVARPALLGSWVPNGWNDYISPAANQAQFVQQRLKTAVFAERVAEQAGDGFAGVITTADVKSGTWAAEQGPNLLTIGYTGGDAETARRIAQAAIDTYAEVEREETIAVSKQAEEFYTREQESVAKERDEAANALSAYVRVTPGLSFEVRERDAEYQRLESERKQAQDAYNASAAKLMGIKQLIAQTQEGQSQTFQPTDAPAQPLAPLPRSKMGIIGPPALAFLLAAAIAAAMFGFLFRTDSTLRSIDDLVMLPGIQLLGIIPDVASVGGRSLPAHYVRLLAASGEEGVRGPGQR
jgi:hypothetical protein